MTTIPPSPPPLPASVAPQPVVTAVPASELPAQIASLPPNAIIEATVLAVPQTAVATSPSAPAAPAAQRGLVQLSTPLGTITVRLPIPLPPNATLRLQVQGIGAALQLRVIAINGQALAGGAAAAGASLVTAETDGLLLPSGSLAGARAGNGILPPPSSPSVAAAGAGGAIEDSLPPANPTGGLPATVIVAADPALPSGTQFTVRLLSVVPPGNSAPAASAPGMAPEPSQPSPSGATASTDRASAPGAALSRPAAPGDALALPGSNDTAGNPSSTAADAEGPPTSTPAAAGTGASPPTASAAVAPGASDAPSAPSAVGTPAAPPATITGQVAPNSLAGQPLIQSSAGLISLGGGADLAPGSRVTLQPIGPPTPPAPATNAAQPAAGTAAALPSLGDTVATLQRADPTIAQLVMERLPDLNPQFAVNLVALVAATQSGDMRSWLGDRAIKTLEKAGRADLAAKIDGEAAEMSTVVTVPQTDGEWQSLTLPLFFGQRIEQVRVIVRRRKDEHDDDEGRDEEGLRFLVDVDMSRLGALQFDGLVKRQAKQFDLIVRSRLELSDPVRRDINGIFIRSLDGLGLTGSVQFKQAVAFVDPIPLHAEHAGLSA